MSFSPTTSSSTTHSISYCGGCTGPYKAGPSDSRVQLHCGHLFHESCAVSLETCKACLASGKKDFALIPLQGAPKSRKETISIISATAVAFFAVLYAIGSMDRWRNS